MSVGGCTPLSVRCTWKRRTSSAVAVSGERPRKLGEALDMTDIVVLGLLAELADGHVLEHAAAKIGLMGFSLIGGSCLEVGGCEPLDPQDGAPRPSSSPDQPVTAPVATNTILRAALSRVSGFVVCRACSVAWR